MGFVDAIKSGFRNRINFGGRATRSEFWFWAMFVVLYSFFLLQAFLAMNLSVAYMTPGLSIVGLLTLVAILPGIALIVRRMHDLDRSGRLVLVIVVPMLGQLVFLVWMCMRGTRGPNRFGADPLAPAPSPAVAPAAAN